MSTTNSYPARYRTPLIYFAVLLGLAVLALNAHFKNADSKRATSGRIRTVISGWMPFVLETPPKQDGERLILLISNSQGFGFEVRPEHAYPTLLESRLNEGTDTPTRIVNWSVTGGAAPEFTILAAAADRLDADLVLYVAATSNFDQRFYEAQGRRTRLKRFWTDIRYLITYREVWRDLPIPFRQRYCDLPAITDSLLARTWYAWRYRQRPMRPWKLKPATRPFVVNPLQRRRDSEAWQEVAGNIWAEDREAIINYKLVDWFLEGFSDVPAKKMFIFMPISADNISTSKDDLASYVAQACQEAGIEVLDLSNAIADEHFASKTHLNADGHKLMSEILLERLEP